MDKSEPKHDKHPSWKMLVGIVSLMLLVTATSVSTWTVFSSSASAAGWVWDLFDFGSIIINNFKSPTLQLKTFSFPSPSPVPAPAGVVDCGHPETPGIKWETDGGQSLIRAFSPSVVGPGETLHVWFSDENTMMLGVNAPGFTSTKMTSAAPEHVINPSIGDPTATDPTGRPIYPALFLTDITSPNELSKAGDFENGGKPITAHEVWGTWKFATQTAQGYVSDNDPDPNVHKNIWDLAGGMVPPAGTTHEEYGALVDWHVDQLDFPVGSGTRLQSGHQYRMQFIFHDGDQTKGGGDLAVGCATIQIP